MFEIKASLEISLWLAKTGDAFLSNYLIAVALKACGM